MLRLRPDCGDDTPADLKESTMAWIVIGVVLIVAFGPVLWLLPSKRDRRLAALRARARAEGIAVEIRRIPNPDPTPEERVTAGGKVLDPVIECAAYGYPLARKLRHLPTWRVVRRASGQGEPDPLPDWSYDLRPKGEWRRYLSRLMPPVTTALAELPSDVVAFEVASTALLAYWMERPGSDEDTVTQMAATLRALGESFGGLEDQITAEFDNEDS
jgi:hypothetical protein